MKFIDITHLENTVTIDGYSTRKTMKGAIREMGKWVAEHIDEGEGQAIMDYPEESLLMAKDSCGGFFLEAEPVGCATRMNEETEEMEYAEGNWYIVVRLVI